MISRFAWLLMAIGAVLFVLSGAVLIALLLAAQWIARHL